MSFFLLCIPVKYARNGNLMNLFLTEIFFSFSNGFLVWLERGGPCWWGMHPFRVYLSLPRHVPQQSLSDCPFQLWRNGTKGCAWIADELFVLRHTFLFSSSSKSGLVLESFRIKSNWFRDEMANFQSKRTWHNKPWRFFSTFYAQNVTDRIFFLVLFS